jgi:hypothetical protein
MSAQEQKQLVEPVVAEIQDIQRTVDNDAFGMVAQIYLIIDREVLSGTMIDTTKLQEEISKQIAPVLTKAIIERVVKK